MFTFVTRCASQDYLYDDIRSRREKVWGTSRWNNGNENEANSAALPRESRLSAMPRQNLYKLIERTVIQQTYLPLSGLGSNASLVHPIRRIPAKFRKFSLDAPCLLVEALIYIMARRYSVSSRFFPLPPPPPFASPLYSCSFTVKREEAGSHPRVRKGTRERRRIRNRCLALLGFSLFLFLSRSSFLLCSAKGGTSRGCSIFPPFQAFQTRHDALGRSSPC